MHRRAFVNIESRKDEARKCNTSRGCRGLLQSVPWKMKKTISSVLVIPRASEVPGGESKTTRLPTITRRASLVVCGPLIHKGFSSHPDTLSFEVTLSTSTCRKGRREKNAPPSLEPRVCYPATSRTNLHSEKTSPTPSPCVHTRVTR